MRVRSRRTRLVLVVVFALAMGLASYHIGVSYWSHRQLDAAWASLERYDYPEAAADLVGYLSVWPEDPGVRLLSAQVARRRGDFVEADHQLGEAERYGASPEAIAVERQLLQVQAGNLGAVDRLFQVCRAAPSDPAAALILEAIIEGSLKSLDLFRAKEGVDLWLGHRPGRYDQVQGLVWRGRVLEFSQDDSHALADFREAVEMAPNHVQARLRLAEALIRGSPNQAVEHLKWLQQHRPEDPEVWMLAARLSRVLGQPEEAAQLLDKVLARAPDEVFALVERGRIEMDLNRPQEAERWLFHAVSLAPELREVNLALGDCLRQSGRLDEAARYQDKGQEIAARLKRKLEEPSPSNKKGLAHQ